MPVQICLAYETTRLYVIATRTIFTVVLQIIQPPADLYIITFDESTSSVQLMCSLNIDIPSSVTVTWLRNSNLAMTTPPNGVITAGNTTTLVIGNPQPSDKGVYECVFIEMSMPLLRRLIDLG